MKPLLKDSPHAAAYTTAWKTIIKLATNEPHAPVKLAWNHTTSARKARAEFLTALHNRINARDPKPYTKKQNADYEAQEHRDRNRLRDIRNRIRVYQFETRAVRERFSHLLSHYDD